jgi:hypothetical protein
MVPTSPTSIPLGPPTPLESLVSHIGRASGHPIEIVESAFLRPWLVSETSTQDFAATGDSVSDVIVLIGDTHWGTRDAMLDDSAPPYTPIGDFIEDAPDNLELLIRLLTSFRAEGVTNIIQLGDFFELWETEYLIYSRQKAKRKEEWRERYRAAYEPAIQWGAPPEARHELYKLLGESEKEEARYEGALRHDTLVPEAEREIRIAWKGRLERLDSLISVRLRGNHDWMTEGKGGTQGPLPGSTDPKVPPNSFVKLGLVDRVFAEHGHRFDSFNCYPDQWKFGLRTIPYIKGGAKVAADAVRESFGLPTVFSGHKGYSVSQLMESGEADPAPEGKRLTWNHAAQEMKNADNEYDGDNPYFSGLGVDDSRAVMNLWIHSLCRSPEDAASMPRVYVIGHTHAPLIQKILFIGEGVAVRCAP